MSGSAAFELTEEDFVAANRLHARSVLLSRKMLLRFLALWGGTVLFVTAIFALIGAWGEGTVRTLVILTIMFPLLVAITGLLPQWLFGDRTARRTFRQQKSLRGPIAYRWSEEGLTGEMERNHGFSRWSDYVRLRENGDVVLFYLSDPLFQIVPKRILSPEQAADLLECASSVPRD